MKRIFLLIAALLLLSSCMDRPGKQPITTGDPPSDPPASVTASTTAPPADDAPTKLPEGARELRRMAFPILATMEDGGTILDARLIHAEDGAGTPMIYLDARAEDGTLLAHLILPGYAQILAVTDEGEDAVSGLRIVGVGKTASDVEGFLYYGGYLTFTALTESGAPRPAPAWVGLSHQGRFGPSEREFRRVESLIDNMLTEHYLESTQTQTDFGTRSFSLLLDSFTDPSSPRHHDLSDHADPGLSHSATKEQAGLSPDHVREILQIP